MRLTNFFWSHCDTTIFLCVQQDGKYVHFLSCSFALEWVKLKITSDKPSYPQFNPVWISRSGLFGSLAFATALIWVKTARVKNKVCKSDFNSANFGPTGKFQLNISEILVKFWIKWTQQNPQIRKKKSGTCSQNLCYRGHQKQWCLRVADSGATYLQFGTKKGMGSKKSRAGNSNRIKFWV